jgi:lantibiotic biosynthesis protein
MPMYHTINICQHVAQKLSNPNFIRETIDHSIKNNQFYDTTWNEKSLMHGFPGIAAFFAMMDEAFPNEKWDVAAHSYLKLATEAFESKGYSSASLYTGLTGLCAGAFLCSKQGTRYKKLNDKLDRILIQEIQHFLYKQLIPSLEDEKVFISPKIYNLADGISGFLVYAAMRKDNSHLHSLASDCIRKMYFILKDKKLALNHSSLSEQNVPGWYISNEHCLDEEKDLYLQGCYSLSLPFGITGFLNAVSLAALEGFCPKEGYELINQVSHWLMSKKGDYMHGYFWPHTIALEADLDNQSNSPVLNRDAWCYGIPAITRSLYLAAKATKNNSLLDFSEKMFNSMWLKEEKEWNLIGTSFSYGRAGHLAIATQMNKDTNNPTLHKKLDDLENGLKKFYDPNHPFGFQSVNFSEEGDYIWVNDPGLMNGSAGIAITLLHLHKPIDPMFNRLFMIC